MKLGVDGIYVDIVDIVEQCGVKMGKRKGRKWSVRRGSEQRNRSGKRVVDEMKKMRKV